MALAGYFTYELLADERSQSPLNKEMFVLGTTTNGHYQIELTCSACHISFQRVKQEACLDCHGEALKAAGFPPKEQIGVPPVPWTIYGLGFKSCIAVVGGSVLNISSSRS